MGSKSPERLLPSPRTGGKTLFGTDFEITQKIIISATEQDINNRKETRQSTGTFLHAPKFGELWSRNG